MASIYDLKPRFQAGLRPVVNRLAAVHVTPNQVTVSALLLSVITGTVIACLPHDHKILLLLPLVLFIRMALNAVDGMLAREHGMQSDFGQMLNEIGDVASDAALYLPLALVTGFQPILVTVIVLSAVIGEMTGVVSQTFGASRRYDGPLGKSDRAFVFGVLGLLLGLGIPAGTWLTAVLGIVLALSFLTVMNRMRRGLRETQA